MSGDIDPKRQWAAITGQVTMPPADPTPPLTAARIARLVTASYFIEPEGAGEAFRGILAAHAALTAELAQRTAERDAARERHRAVENILRNVEEHHVQQNQWKGCDETRSHTLKWIREARATLAAPTEG